MSDLINRQNKERHTHTQTTHTNRPMGVFKYTTWRCLDEHAADCPGSSSFFAQACLRVLTYFEAFGNWQDKVLKCYVVCEKQCAIDKMFNKKHSEVKYSTDNHADIIQSGAQSAANAPCVTPTNIQMCRHICAMSSSNSPLPALQPNMAATAIAVQK